MIRRRDREITFLVARTVSQIVLYPSRIPAAFFSIDEVETFVLVLIESHVVEDEELGFGTEVGGVGQAGRHQIHLGLFGDVTGIAIIALLGHWIDHVAHHHHRGNFGEGIKHVFRGVGNQQHVAFVNGCPAANG